MAFFDPKTGGMSLLDRLALGFSNQADPTYLSRFKQMQAEEAQNSEIAKYTANFQQESQPLPWQSPEEQAANPNKPLSADPLRFLSGAAKIDPKYIPAFVESLQSRQNALAPKYETKEVNGQLIRYNANDPNSKPEVVFGQTGGMNPKTVQGEGDLRKEFDGLQKDFRSVQDAYSRVQASVNDPSPAGDLALIFNYMKILDPGSTVREGEFATAQNATGVPGQVLNAYNKALSGERLNPDQRADFSTRAQALYEAQAGNFNTAATKYRDLATQYGYNPDRIVKPLNIKKKDAKPLAQLSTQELLARLKKK